MVCPRNNNDLQMVYQVLEVCLTIIFNTKECTDLVSAGKRYMYFFVVLNVAPSLYFRDNRSCVETEQMSGFGSFSSDYY